MQVILACPDLDASESEPDFAKVVASLEAGTHVPEDKRAAYAASVRVMQESYFGLLHGVRVACDGADADCARYSLVLWFQEDAAKCAAGGEVAALGGRVEDVGRDPHAQGLGPEAGGGAGRAAAVDVVGVHGVREGHVGAGEQPKGLSHGIPR